MCDGGDRRVAGERQFGAGREDADLRVVVRRFGREEEDGLGEMLVQRDPLHRLGVETVAIDDGGRVAFERGRS